MQRRRRRYGQLRQPCCYSWLRIKRSPLGTTVRRLFHIPSLFGLGRLRFSNPFLFFCPKSSSHPPLTGLGGAFQEPPSGAASRSRLQEPPPRGAVREHVFPSPPYLGSGELVFPTPAYFLSEGFAPSPPYSGSGGLDFPTPAYFFVRRSFPIPSLFPTPSRLILNHE